MSFIDNIQGAVVKLGSTAKKTIDSAKLEFKIQGYSKDISDTLKQIGLLVYEHNKNSEDLNQEFIDIYCDDIYNMKNKLNKLEKELITIRKKNVTSDKTLITTKTDKKYIRLDKKEDDLKIVRTTEGIKILRFCPICSTGNSPNLETCESCGYTFKKNN